MIDLDAAMTFLGFVEARHQAWEARQSGEPGPWTDDPIVNTRKFTNVFRVLDHGSQFVMTDLIDENISPADQLMRLFLYRHTGRVETWEYLNLMMGGYPTLDNLWDAHRLLQEYRGGSKEITCGTTTVGGGSRKGRLFDRPIFTSAYLVFPQSATPGTDKLNSIFELTERLFEDGSPECVVYDFMDNENDPKAQFEVLRRNKGVADFMSMQILTDWGYTPECGYDREDEFVVAGPGARKGAAHIDPSAKPEAVVRWAVEAIRALPNPPKVETRLPSYMDAQNCLCEFSKYVRYMEKPLPSKPYQPAHPGPQDPPVLPAHWN